MSRVDDVAAQLMAEQEQNSQLRLDDNVRMSLNTDAEKRLKAEHLAQVIGEADVDFVERNYATVERSARTRGLFNSLPADSVTRNILSDPRERASLPDAENLAKIEGSITSFGNVAPSYRKGQDVHAGGKQAFQMMVAGSDDATYDTTMAAYNERMGRVQYGDLNWAQRVPGFTAEMAGLYSRMLPEAGMAAAYAGAGAGMAAGPEAVPPAALTGFKIGTTKEMFEVEAGWAFDEFRKLKFEATGLPVDRDAAVGAAILVGGINAGLEFIGFNQAVLHAYGLPQLIKSLGKGGVKNLLNNPAARDAFSKIGQDYAVGVMTEGTTEALQELAVIGFGDLLKGSYSGIEAYGARMWDSFQAGAGGAAGLAAPGAAIRSTNVTLDNRKQKQQQDAIAALGEDIKTSKLYSNAPKKFQEFIRNIQARHGTVDTVYMDAEAAQTYFQNIDQQVLEKDMPETAVALREALDTGGYVAIPLDEFVTYVAPNMADVSQDITFDPLTPTQRQYQEIESKAKELQDWYEKNQGQIDQAEDPVYGQVYTELLGAGRKAAVAEKEAMLFTTMIRRMADRVGMDPEEYYRSKKISIRGELIQQEGIDVPTATGGLINLLREGRGPQQKDVFGPSLIEFLMGTGILDEGGELSARDLEKQIPAYGRRRLARESGIPMTEAFERARDAGYLDLGENVSEENALLAAIDRELGGDRVYSLSQLSSGAQELDTALEQLRELIDRSGLDINTMTNEEIMDRLGITELEQPDTDQEFKDTEKAYGGKEAFEKAKADGRTNLNYRQWVQVRTPAFKAWFGDWEAVSNATMLRSASTLDESKLAAATFIGMPIENRHTKLQGTVSNGNLGKMVSKSSGRKSTNMRDHALAIANVDKLFENALLDATHPDSNGEPTIRDIHRYVAPMLTADGKVVAVKMTVKETTSEKQPNPIYSIETLEIENPPSALSHVNPDGTGIHPQAGLSESVLRALRAVNPDTVSKVTDPKTGEPLVVYHGTDKRFSRINLKKGAQGLFWFTSDKSAIESGDVGAAESGVIMELFAKIEHPADWTQYDQLMLNEFKSRGLDGALLPEDDGTMAGFVIEEPTQIKSATGNRGTFDPNNPNIYYQQGEGEALAAALKDCEAVFSDKSDIPAHNARAEAYGILRAGGFVDRQILDDLRHSGEDMDYHLSRAGEDRSWDDILAEHQNDTDIQPVEFPADIWEIAILSKGTTKDLREAGYILPDGTLLDFSGKRNGGESGTRGEDHRELGFNLGGDTYSGDMVSFIALGAVRIDNNSGSIDIGADPTIEQMELIERVINSAGGGHLDLAQDGRTDSTEVSSAKDARNTIKRFYAGGAAKKSLVQQFRQNGKKGPRGYLEVSPQRLAVTLTKAANLSTFIHESGHLFLELMKDAVTLADADSQLLADWKTVKAYLGSDGNLSVEMHETFARSFEAYLMEGKAPTKELAGLFSRFKSWLIGVYKTLNKLDVELTDDIRAVFDRMLVAEASIERAADDIVPAFKGGAGLSDTEINALMELQRQALRAGQDEMEAQAQAEIRAMRTEAYRNRRDVLTREVTTKIDAKPVYAVQRLLRTGNDENMTVPDHLLGKKLSSQAVINLFLDAKVLRRIPGLTRKEGGVHPDVLADLYGFESGYHLVQQIIAAPPRSEVIRNQVQAQLDEEFGNMAQDTETIERAALALHNNAMANFLVAEARAMNRKLGRKDNVTLNQATKEAARRHVARLKLRQIRPHAYYQAELKAARASQEAIAAGKFEEAAQLKQQQLLNHHLYREARTALDRADLIRRKLKKYDSATVMQNIRKGDPMAANGIEALLAGVELKKTALTKIDARNRLAQYVQAMEAQGEAVLIDPALYEGADLVNYREMTLEQLEALDSSVSALAKQGRDANKIRVEGELVEMAQVIEDLNAVASTNLTAKQINQYDVDHRSPLTKAFSSFLASLRKIEFECRFADGDIVGKWHRTIFQPFVDAQNAKEEMLSTSVTELQSIMGTLSRQDAQRLNQSINFLGTTLNRGDLYVVALNMGNEGNWDRLFSRRWKGQERQVLAKLQDELTLEDFRRIEALGQMIDRMYEPMASVSERVDGIRPPKVEAKPLYLAKYGIELSGWYYPVKYQDAIGTREASVLEESNSIDMGPSPITGQVSKSMTKSRMTGAGGVISLDFAGLPQHLHQVVHYITHYEAVRNFDKLRRKSEFRAMYESYFDANGYKQLRSWLQNIATNGTIAQTSHDASKLMETIARRARFGGSLLGLGWKVSSAVMQVLGTGPAAKEVGALNMASWLLKLSYGRVGTFGQAKVHPDYQKALDASPELRHLDSQMDRDIREFTDRAVEVMRKKPVMAAAHWVSQQAYYMIIAVQKHINAATWLAAHEKAQGQGRTVQESVQYADATVRQTQSGGGLKDLAGIQATGEMGKIFTLFYTYFSVQHNQLRMTGRQDLIKGFIKGDGPNGRAKSLQKFVAANMYIVLVPALVEALLKYDDDDDDNMPLYLANRVASSYLAGVPILREAYRFATAGFSSPSTPVQQMSEATVQAAEGLVDIFTGDGTWTDWRNVAKAGTLISWLPFYQVEMYIEALAASDDFGDLISHILLGTPYSKRKELEGD